MTKLHQVEDEWIETFTGKQFHFIDPQQEEICIEDIAHALSLTCRYGGHTRKFYSVAEHCIHIATLLIQEGYPLKVVLTGLMHDASEAYLGDMLRPIKMAIPAYKGIERRLDVACAKRFGTMYPFPETIKELDYRILRNERDAVMNPSDNKWGVDDVPALQVDLQLWSPEEAESNFLKLYWRIVKAIEREEAEAKAEAEAKTEE